MDDLDTFRPAMRTHFIGDDCKPDGHRAETTPTSEVTIRPGAVAEPPPSPTLGLDELEVVIHPVHEAIAPDEPQADHPERDLDLPVALVYASKDGGTGQGHVVSVRADGSLACTCWPGLRTVKGCHRMVAARKLLGHPPVE